MAIGNTDDHLKNFMMQGGPAGYRLAPAFDLVTDVARNIESVLSINGARYPERATLLEFGARWCRDGNVPERIADEVLAAVRGFGEELESSGADMPPHARLCDDIGARCMALAREASR